MPHPKSCVLEATMAEGWSDTGYIVDEVGDTKNMRMVLLSDALVGNQALEVGGCTPSVFLPVDSCGCKIPGLIIGNKTSVEYLERYIKIMEMAKHKDGKSNKKQSSAADTEDPTTDVEVCVLEKIQKTIHSQSWTSASALQSQMQSS